MKISSILILAFTCFLFSNEEANIQSNLFNQMHISSIKMNSKLESISTDINQIKSHFSERKIYENPSFIGTVSGSCIGAFVLILVAFLAYHREKGNIIRKARIEWIQSLRENISKFHIEVQSAYINIKIEYNKIFELENKDFEKTNARVKDWVIPNMELINKAEATGNIILLHLNPNDKTRSKQEDDLEKEVNKILGMLSFEGIKEEQLSKSKSINDIIDIGRIVLKQTWDFANK